MQTAKIRSGSTENPPRISTTAARSSRPTKLIRSESSTGSPSTQSPSLHRLNAEKRSATSSDQEQKKRGGGGAKLAAELELQVGHLQEELRRSKELLISSEVSKKRALQEAEEARAQLAEFSSVEDARLLELRRLSQERDRAWQSELEATQQQLAALKSQAAARAEADHAELRELKRELVEALSTVEELRVQLAQVGEEEAEAKAMLQEAKQQLEASRCTIDSLLVDGSKLMDSFSLVVSELEESRGRVRRLEQSLEGSSSQNLSAASDQEPRSGSPSCCSSYLEEQIALTLQLQLSYVLLGGVLREAKLRDADLSSRLDGARTDVIRLKAHLFDREAELRRPGMTAAEEAEVELEKVKEEKGRMQLEMEQKEHAAEQSREQAAAALAEMEAELRRVRVQAEQWRKAADAALAIMAVDGNGRQLVDGCESMDRPLGRLLSFGSYAGDVDDGVQGGRRNSNVLKIISGMWRVDSRKH